MLYWIFRFFILSTLTVLSSIGNEHTSAFSERSFTSCHMCVWDTDWCHSRRCNVKRRKEYLCYTRDNLKQLITQRKRGANWCRKQPIYSIYKVGFFLLEVYQYIWSVPSEASYKYRKSNWYEPLLLHYFTYNIIRYIPCKVAYNCNLPVISITSITNNCKSIKTNNLNILLKTN